MPVLLIVGGGLFGSQAAALARSRGIEAVVFDGGLPGAASPAAAGLFREAWAGVKFKDHFRAAVPVLDQLYGLRRVLLQNEEGRSEEYFFVPPAVILEPKPVCQAVTAVGDGWLEAGGERHEGWVYVAAGVWCEQFVPGLGVYGKAGAAFAFAGERAGRARQLAYGRQALAFVRDAGKTYFSDGTAEREFRDEHERQTLARAAEMGLTEAPVERYFGYRPYVPGGPVFRQLSERTWLGTGGRKMGTVLGAALAARLIVELCGR
jgi:glycine/D-amino acid oxidase-like deaminating enzyme